MSASPWRRQRPALILLAAVALATLLTWGNAVWLDNSVLIAVFSLLALSAGMSFGQAGIPSMGTSAFAAIGAYGTAIATLRFGLSPYLGLVIAAVAPVLLAYPLARAVTRLSPLPLSIATFVLAGVVEIAIRGGGALTGGYDGLSGIPPIPGAPLPQETHFVAWGIVILVIWLYVNLMDSAYGRAVATARHDPLRATADGVDVGRLLASFFALSASVAGIGGWLYAHYMSYLAPESLTTSTSITVLLMAVVGGVQSFLGPIVGAALLMIIMSYLPAAESQGMIYGATLVAVLILAPRGLVGLIERLGGLLRGPGGAPAAALRPIGKAAKR